MNPVQQNKPPKKKVFVKKNKKVFSDDFSKFNTDTGDKIAGEKDLSLARMEATTEAKKSRRSASNKEETVKDAATGGSLAFLVGNAAISKDSARLKGLTALRKKGLIGIGGAIGAGVLSRRKQKSDYNRQQASRELLAGKKTGRSSAYKGYLENKYELGK